MLKLQKSLLDARHWRMSHVLVKQTTAKMRELYTGSDNPIILTIVALYGSSKLGLSVRGISRFHISLWLEKKSRKKSGFRFRASVVCFLWIMQEPLCQHLHTSGEKYCLHARLFWIPTWIGTLIKLIPPVRSFSSFRWHLYRFCCHFWLARGRLP